MNLRELHNILGKKGLGYMGVGLGDLRPQNFKASAETRGQECPRHTGELSKSGFGSGWGAEDCRSLLRRFVRHLAGGEL
jgi:hypothetical protein